MAPPPDVVARNGLGIFNDPTYTVAADARRVENVGPTDTNHSSPLRTISSLNTDNRQPKPVSRVESLTAQLEKLHICDSHQVTQCKGKPAAKPKAQPGTRATRPPLTANTFAPLETVAEDEQAEVSKSDAAAVSSEAPRYIELPVDRYAQHPLALAALASPSAAEQFAKQRNGDFDWVLTVKPPAVPESSDRKKLFFGCNLLPVPTPSGNEAPSEKAGSYTLLATPLEGNEEPVVHSPAAKETTMALTDAPQKRLSPAKAGAEPLPVVRVEERAPALVEARDGNGSSVLAGVSRVPAKAVEGIEAIDQFEEEMEAFELAAGFKTSTAPTVGVTGIRSPKMTTLSLGPVPQGGRTPTTQPKGSPPVVDGFQSKSGRRPSSKILLDSPKLKGEDKALAQAPLKKVPGKTLASLQPPKPLARSTKTPTVAAFELPGEAVARRLKEQREARLASRSAKPKPLQDGRDQTSRRLREKRQSRLSTQSAQTGPEDNSMPVSKVKPKSWGDPDYDSDEELARVLEEKANYRLTPPWLIRCSPEPEVKGEDKSEPPKPTSSLRRAKSTKAPTLPKFELPGEAISRRKREEKEAKRKAQEEEERKRRQFKARPVRSAAAPSTMPRETLASRARVNGTLFEKRAQQASPTPNKRASMVLDTRSRGRHLTAATADHAGPQASRATSSSAGSTGKRSSVSLEEVQQQRVRGKDIFQRDNAYTQDRAKERRDRETMARMAREEAAERSRQKSREWAEKQKRKRMTVSSMRDLTGA